MSGAFGSLGLEAAFLLVLGAALWFAARGVRWVIGVFPMNKERRAALLRTSPVAGAALTLLYLLFPARTLFRRQPVALPIVLALVVTAFVAAAWPMARDFLAGVALKTGRVCDEGDEVRIGDVEGRVVRMGHRVLVIETRDGDEAILPYAGVAREAVVRTRTLGGVTPHKFRIEAPPADPFAELRAQIIRVTLLCHWSAFAREPEVVPAGDRSIEVTVFCLDGAHGRDIETAVRSAIREGGSPRAAGG